MVRTRAAGNYVASRVSGAERPRGGGREPAAWGGELRDYLVLGGVRVPTRAEAYWDLPEGRFTYWRAEVTAVEALDAPYR